MRYVATLAYRALRRRGPRQFLKKAAIDATRNWLVPRVQSRFISNALYREDLANICADEGTFFDYYGEEERHILGLPTVPGGYDPGNEAYVEATYCSGMEIDAPFVAELEAVDFVGPNAIPIKNGGYVFEHFFYSTGLLTTSCLSSMARGTRPRGFQTPDHPSSFDVVLSLVGPWNYNYTHWFQDYLVKLEGLEFYEDLTGCEPTLLIPPDASGWMLDALRATGVDPDRWVEWTGGRVRADRLIVPAIRREERGNSPNRRILYSATGLEWLRDRIMANIEPEQTVPHASRIYLSRDGALKRRVVNEVETMEALSKWGFKRYRPETLSFAEQVTLFREAEAIVSPHGSGLMNQIWADEATVIEIFGPKQGITSPASEYYYAEQLGHDYGCLQGETVGPDVRIDVSSLETLLEMMLD